MVIWSLLRHCRVLGPVLHYHQERHTSPLNSPKNKAHVCIQMYVITLHSLLPHISSTVSAVEEADEYGRGEDDEGEVEEGVAPQDGAPEQRHHLLAAALMVSILAQLES